VQSPFCGSLHPLSQDNERTFLKHDFNHAQSSNKFLDVCEAPSPSKPEHRRAGGRLACEQLPELLPLPNNLPASLFALK
jgi:hypothetical protein